MRIMELIMAFVMGAFSVYQAIKSAELPVGWIPGEGPGGGAFPFWLSVGMIICCVAIIVNWFRGPFPEKLRRITKLLPATAACGGFRPNRPRAGGAGEEN